MRRSHPSYSPSPSTPTNTLPALPRNLLRHRHQTLDSHSREILHLSRRTSWPTPHQNNKRDHRRALHNDNRDGPAQEGAGEHTAVKGYGELSGEEARNGSAGERTEDEESDLDGAETE